MTIRLKKYKQPLIYTPPSITLEESSPTPNEISSSERKSKEPLSSLELAVPSALKETFLSTKVCGNPACRKRMTIKEASSSSGNPYIYCSTCRNKCQQKSRDKRYKKRVKELLHEINKDKFYLALNKEFPGFADFKSYPSSPPIYYIHFLHFRSDLYPLVAEVFSEEFFPVIPPSHNEIFHAKEILQVITTHKKCANCHQTKSTWYIKKEDPNFPPYINRITGKKEVTYFPPPNIPASLEDIIYILQKAHSHHRKFTLFLSPNQFNKSYSSKDFWKAGCKTCYKEK